MKTLSFDEIDEGTQIPGLSIEADILRLIKYAGSTWNFYLLHLDGKFAKEKGFRDVNIPGPFYGALLAKMMTAWTGDIATLKKLGYSVTEMGFVNDTLYASGIVANKCREFDECLVNCRIWIQNQDDVRIVTGSALLSFLQNRSRL